MCAFVFFPPSQSGGESKGERVSMPPSSPPSPFFICETQRSGVAKEHEIRGEKTVKQKEGEKTTKQKGGRGIGKAGVVKDEKKVVSKPRVQTRLPLS